MSGPWEDFQPTPQGGVSGPAPQVEGPWQDFSQASAPADPQAAGAAPIGPSMQGPPASAMAPAPHQPVGFINSETGEAYSDPQEATYADLAKRGLLDRNADPGSQKFPLAQTDPRDLPKPGDWYVDTAGKVQRRPEDPWSNTAAHLATSMLFPVAERFLPQDPRFDAGKSAMASGVLLGGKNELVSLLSSLPALASGGGNSFSDRFGSTLANLDRQDGQSRRDYPLVYNGSAAAGALLGGLAVPEAELGLGARAAVNAGVGGASGALSTDGGWADRAKGGALGALTGAVLGPLSAVALGKLPRTVTPDAMGAATDELSKIGLALDNMPDGTVDRLKASLAKGAEPSDLAMVTAAQTLPAPIPLTRGQVTGLPEDQMAFNMALRGTRGPVAGGRAQDFAKAQQGAIRQNVQDIASALAGGDPPVLGQGGTPISTELNDLHASGKAAVDGAYDAARATPAPAILPAYDAKAMAGAVRNSLSDFDPLNVPRVGRELDRLDSLSKGDVNLQDLFNSRTRLSTLKMSNDPVEAAAAGRAVSQVDHGINDAISADLFHGDPASVEKWKAAIGQRREFGQIFEQGDLVDRLTQRSGTGGARRLTIDPGDAANYILGRSNLGFVGKQNLYGDLAKVKALVSPEAWNSLRSEIFQRIASAGEGGVENGSQQFSGANLLKAWNTAKGKDSRLVETIFSPKERAQIDQFATVTARVTSPVKGGDNPSGTAAWLMRAGKKVGGGLLMGLDAVPVLDALPHAIENIAQRAATARALAGLPRIKPSPALPLLPGRAAGYAGARVAEPSN